MSFTGRQLQENCQEAYAHGLIIDLMKAFDSLDHQTLWSILSWYGCNDKCISMLQLLHVGMSATGLNSDGPESEPFSGVK